MNPRLRAFCLSAIVWILAFDIAWVWQRVEGAHTSEFGGHPDEAAHYVTGLFVHDAIVMLPQCIGERSFAKLQQFADKDSPAGFYAHYPKVGLGVWPPVFYIAQSMWTLPFGTERLSVMLLMALLAATLALQLYLALKEESGPALAFAAAVALLSLPLFRDYYSMVMAEMLTAVFMFAAMLSFGRFLDRDRARDALWFGVWSGLAIMTKGTGLALAFLPPLAILLTGKWRVLTRPALWGGAALCAVLAGPWTWKFRDYGREKGGWLEASPSLHFTAEAAPYYATKLALGVGILLVVFFCIGLAVKLSRRERRTGLWASAAAMIFAVFVFQLIMPVGLEERHILSALPAILMFAVAGIAAATIRFGPRGRLAGGIVVLGLGVLVQSRLDPSMNKHWSGFAPLAEQVLSGDAAAKSMVLVSSDARGEGQFISEMAMHEHRPGHIIQRGSKELAKSDWAGRGLKLRFETEDDLANWLGKSKIDYIVADASMPEEKRTEQHDQVLRACQTHVDRFWPISRMPIVRGGTEPAGEAILYKVRH